jgi:hypothetical protein
MTVVGIDPGSSRSAVVVTDGTKIFFKVLDENFRVIEMLRRMGSDKLPCAIETLRTWASPFVSKKGAPARTPVEIFEACYWGGRFTEAYGPSYVQQLTRSKVRSHILGKGFKKQEQSTDTLIRAALIQRFGGDDKTAKGTVKAPGPLHGFSNDLYAALAVALTYLEAR